MSIHSYIRLKSGIKFSYTHPTIAMVNLEDIVWSLSHLPRFLAHTDKPYSILRHSILVHDLAPDECKLEALAHDFSESLCADIPSPLKRLLPDYCAIEQRVEKVIVRKFGLRFPYPSPVKTCDLIALATEMKQLCGGRDDYKDMPYPPADIKITLWSPEKTRREFMKRWTKLSKHV